MRLSRIRANNSGFTIVELLIVIVVIAILAAISIVAYRGIQNRAHASSVQSDFSNIAKRAEIYRIDSANDSYPSSIANLTNTDLKFSKGSYDAVIWCSNASPATMWAVVADAKDGKTYVYNGVTKAFSEFTANKVQGSSGGTTCPAVNAGMGSWTWILQIPSGTWQV